ncbi:D-alanine--D-alanine ligase [Streptomyces sp. NBC_00268]|uniref:D-alanine--D-alanine ligase family protein n=1 Tax=Streptomyces sp. NBC_00268 TaxID=2975695 RepID=UPI00225218C6|nr:D-alanine--D-alanine ligase [Streptomyces sp. NBC_00268]MCX5182632.1 D-alanine--D-alanine ligase [Streptomyces sp. NBC_00268]
MTVATVPDIATLRIGVLCGGDSPERPGSLASGQHAYNALSAAGLTAELVDVADASVSALKDNIDVALLGLHGLGGEDGKVQGALETAGIPYSGSGVLASALGMHKPTFKKLITQARIDTPSWTVVDPGLSVDAMLSVVRHSIGFPVFVKPSSGGGSLAAGIAWDDATLRPMIEAAADSGQYAEYLIEEYVPGIPCTVGLVQVDGRLVVLPVHDVESKNEFYDYAAKHDPDQRVEHCPSILPDLTTQTMAHTAQAVYHLLGAHGVLRIDYMASSTGRNPLLEVNTLPGLSEHGNLATMARAGGIPYSELIQHLVRTAFTKPAYLP